MGNELFELNSRTTNRETVVTDAQISTGVTGNIRNAVIKNDPHAYDKLFEIGNSGTKEDPAVINLNSNPAPDRPDEDITISFNVAGSSFAQPLRYDLGLAGKSNALISKDGKLGKYKKGKADEEYIYEEDGEEIKLKGDQVEKFVSNKLIQAYGRPAVFTQYDGDKPKSLILKDIRVKKNNNNGFDYSISGPRIDVLGKKNVGAFNLGDYSIDRTRKNIRDIGRGHLMALVRDPKFMNGKGKINFDFTGHSRGGVGAVQGAMMLKHLVETEYPQLKDRVSFSVLLYDPVPGPKNRVKSNVNHAINLREQTKEMKEQKMAAFGENDKSVVVYSIGCNHAHGFDPMKVMGADTVIMTGQNHDEGLKDVEMQFGKKTRQAYINAENCEAYQTDGLRSMPKGIFVADENKVMVRMKDTNAAEEVIRNVLPNQNDRTRRVLEVCSDIDIRNGGEPSLEVIARGFNAHDPFYIISSKEFREMRKNFTKLAEMTRSDKRNIKDIIALRDTLRKNAVDYVTSKLGKEPYSNRTQGRLAVAKNIIRVLDLNRDRTLNWNIKTQFEKSPDDIHIQREFLESSKKTYEQNKDFLAKVSNRYLEGKPVEHELFEDTIVSMMTDRYFIKQSEKYSEAMNEGFTDKLGDLLGEGNLSLFQTFKQSKTIKEIASHISTEDLANVFASGRNVEQVLDNLIDSAVNEKSMEVKKANTNIKQNEMLNLQP